MFRQAYFNLSDDGRYDVVLLEDGLTPPHQRKANAPIGVSNAAPLAQTVHIRVLWRPLNGSKPDAPSATNASIDWLISNNAPAGREDRLHYRGAGFVVLYGSGQQIRFDVRNVHLELTERVGQLKDPLGSCTLSGSFLAVRNPGIVSATLDDLKQAATTSPEPQQSTAHEGPPPRGGPTGP